MSDCIQVSTTAVTREEADSIARLLVERRLAACVQVLGPLTSTYRWQGAVQSTEEYLCLIKTTAELYPDVERTIRGVHSYDVPEIIAQPITGGSAEYIGWLADQVS